MNSPSEDRHRPRGGEEPTLKPRICPLAFLLRKRVWHRVVQPANQFAFRVSKQRFRDTLPQKPAKRATGDLRAIFFFFRPRAAIRIVSSIVI